MVHDAEISIGDAVRRLNPGLYAPAQPQGCPKTAFSGKERQLHDRIEEDLKVRRFYFVHSRMDRASTNALGTPDFIIARPGGSTLWVEVKVKGGKLSKEQTIAKHLLEALGHRYALVYSWEDYQSAIAAALSSANALWREPRRSPDS